MTAALTRRKIDAEVSPRTAAICWWRDGRCARTARPARRARRQSIVCGDRVRCEHDRAHDELLAVEVLPRQTLLARANLRGESEPVVANITQLVVVVAPVPQPDFFIVDRYLCAATAAGIAGADRRQQVRPRD
jgi:putative ribosome biogenesis GTPase RsgA